jgi:sulfide:quinone oxidoreductase
MRNLVILGGGTAGTMLANKLRKRLGDDDWTVTVVDRDDEHHYQPGYLFVPFGAYLPREIVRSRHHFITDGVRIVYDEVEQVSPEDGTVRLGSGRLLSYDYLVIATGTTPRPDQTPGMLGPEWRRSIFDFYTLEGAEALATALQSFDHGRLVVHVCELPIKCPVAPLELTFLAEAWLREHGIRDRV